MKVAIIGAGASGLVAAIEALKRGHEVHLYEQESKVAKKILASGNGRCNISNTSLKIEDYFGSEPSFVKTALTQFGFADLERFFHALGLMLEIKSDGRAYPYSNEAKAVSNALLRTAKHLGVHIYIDAKVLRLEKQETFSVYLEGKVDTGFTKVMIATGSQAAPQLGADGSGYALVKTFGHTLITPYPSLVALQTADTAFMAGAKKEAEVSVYVAKKKRASASGDVLFTKYGLSGFGVLDVSEFVSTALRDGEEVSVGINLLPEFERSELLGKLTKMVKKVSFLDTLSLLCGFIPQKMALGVLKSCEIVPQIKASELNQKQLRKILNTLQDWRFSISDTHGFKHAEVSGGGLDVKEIDAKTYQSKLTKGLYFGGEVLDIVGKRGGYNLHFAFASGFVVGASI